MTLILLFNTVLLTSIVALCNGFQYQPRAVGSSLDIAKCPSIFRLQAGFGKPKFIATEESKIPAGNTPCVCGSGKVYQDCCQSIHEGKVEALNPVQTIRARFSGFIYGAVPYLTKSTHPDSKEYVAEDNNDTKLGSRKTKRSVWEKKFKYFGDTFDYKNLVFIDEMRDSNPPSDAKEATVEVTLERKLKGGAIKYDFIKEVFTLKKLPSSNSWGVLSSYTNVKGAYEKIVKSSADDIVFKK